jgi:hypothetical protein
VARTRRASGVRTSVRRSGLLVASVLAVVGVLGLTGVLVPSAARVHSTVVPDAARTAYGPPAQIILPAPVIGSEPATGTPPVAGVPPIAAPAAPAAPVVKAPGPTALVAEKLDRAGRQAAEAARRRIDDQRKKAEAEAERAAAAAAQAPASVTVPGGGSTPTAPSLSTLIALTAPAQKLFVSPQGDDSNQGTQAAPVRSIERAAAMSRPGTHVVVADGTYPGSVTTDVSGTAQARIAFVSATRGGAKIVGDRGSAAWRNRGNYVDIVGFDITGANEDGLTSEGSYDRIAGNRVHGFRAGNCITTASGDYALHDIDVIGNVAFGCGSDRLDHGIYVGHARGVVANNISYGNAGFGIHCWHACNALTISNNLVFNNPQGGVLIGQGDGPNFGNVQADNIVVANNIAIGNGRDAMREVGGTGPHNRFLNNIFWNNEVNDISFHDGSESGTKVQDPALVDFRGDGTGDYRLRPNSPGIGAGVQHGAPPNDIDGTPRPTNGGIDIGAYQR